MPGAVWCAGLGAATCMAEGGIGAALGGVFCGENGPAYEFGDLGDDGVSEGFKSVHPVGYPMSSSTNEGFR